MPTIVRHLEDSRQYVLVGTGYGRSDSMKPHWLFGNWGQDRRRSEIAVVCICDQSGTLLWANADEVVIESIDGVRPNELLCGDRMDGQTELRDDLTSHTGGT